MDKKDNLGDEIKDILQDALNTRNFNRLNQDIGRTVNSALRDFENVFTGRPSINDDPLWKPLSKEEPPVNNQGNRENYESRGNQGNRQRWYGDKAGTNQKQYPKNVNDSRISRKPAGSVAGILLIVFGFLGVALLSFSLLAYGIATTLTGLNLVNGFTLGAIIPLFAISGVMAGKGIQLRKRIGRFNRYCFKLNGRNYCNIKELSQSTGKSEKFVAKDLQKMIHLGMFLQGHLDKEQTCFILDDATYKQYADLQKWQKDQQVVDEAQKQEMAKKQAAAENEGVAQRELRNTIEEGKAYIGQIRKANDDIPGEAVSVKLDRLETITSKIFHHIETHPEQISEIRKFMNYYLPTTLKLTNTYKELDKQTVAGGNITSAKVEIEKTLDTINLAFENLLDGLFYHTAMDISSDITVLETMLAQEGLTEKEFIAKGNKEK